MINLSALHPDLQPHVEHEPRLGRLVLHHPLVIDLNPKSPLVLSEADAAELGYSTNIERLNQLYEHKRKALADAEAAADWDTFVFVHERPYRVEALQHVIELNDWRMAKMRPNRALSAWWFMRPAGYSCSRSCL